MELLAPKLLIFGITFLLMNVSTSIVAMIYLYNDKSRVGSGKFFWLMVIIMIPIIGSISYLAFGRKRLIESR